MNSKVRRFDIIIGDDFSSFINKLNDANANAIDLNMFLGEFTAKQYDEDFEYDKCIEALRNHLDMKARSIVGENAVDMLKLLRAGAIQTVQFLDDLMMLIEEE